MSPDNARQLIITADDFGLSHEVNEAVRQAASHGVLTAASLMMGEVATDAAVRLAHSLPGLRVGLHLVLVDGHAVLSPRRIPDLVNSDGRFSNAMVRNSFRFVTLRRVREQLAAEIRAQFEAFARTGLRLDHVNAHKHFHLHPLILELLLRIGGEFGMSAVRIPREPGGALFLAPWLALMRARLRKHGLTINDQVFGLNATGRLDTQQLIDIVMRLPAGTTEIYLHPAVGNDELTALLDPDFRLAVDASLAVRGGYRDVREREQQNNPK